MPIPIPNLPSDVRVPLFYASVDPSRANTLQRTHAALIPAQITPGGSLTPAAPVLGTTNGVTAAASAILHFAAVPAGVAPGQVITDTTAPSVIPAGTTVISKTATTVVMSAAATGAGVGATDAMVFTTPFVSAPVLAVSKVAVDTLCGAGSLGSLIYQFFRKNNLNTTVYLVPLQDDGAAVKAAGTVEIAGTPTANGTLALYIAGVAVPVLVTSTMTPTLIATAIAAAINLNADLPVTAAPAVGVVTLTAKNAGLCGNDIDIRQNYYGSANGENPVPGISVIITPMSGGTTNPATGLTAALAALPEAAYDYLVHPYSDSSSLDALRTYFSDVAGQWSPIKQFYGGSFTAKSGTLGALQTAGLLRNDPHATIMGVYNSPSPPYAWAGALGGMAALSLSSDPSIPCREVVLQGILPPPLASLFHKFPDRNTLLWSGISTFKVIGGEVIVERVISTYQLNTFGTPDNSMLSVEKLFTLAEGLRLLRARVESVYGRCKLADDGNRFGPEARVATPRTIKADQIAFYDQELVQKRAWFQDTDAFAAGLVVERNADDPDRVDELWDAIVIDQLNVFAVLAQFRQTAAT